MASTFVLNTLIPMIGKSNLARVQSLFPSGLFSTTQGTLWEEIFKTRKTQHISIHGKGKKGKRPLWTGISPAEIERRDALISQDFAIDLKNTSALATTKQVILTKTSPCALAEAQVVLSKQWGWTISPVHGVANIFYQAYGVIRRGSLDTNFDDDSVPLNFLAARGELNASVRGTITNELNLDQWSASQPPDDEPVRDKGNSECWGDETRQARAHHSTNSPKSSMQ
jgi:hypothetical protein